VVSDQIKRLSARFTKEHPELIALKKESREISEQIERGALKSTIFDQDIQARAFTHSQSEAPIQDIYHELLKKLSHLEIVLRMEESRDDGGVMYLSILKEPSEPTEPFSPDLIRLIFLGVLGGSGLAILQGLYFERKRALEVCTEKFLEDFGVAKLGQLSALPSTQRLALISGSNPRALPPPDQEEA